MGASGMDTRYKFPSCDTLFTRDEAIERAGRALASLTLVGARGNSVLAVAYRAGRAVGVVRITITDRRTSIKAA